MSAKQLTLALRPRGFPWLSLGVWIAVVLLFTAGGWFLGKRVDIAAYFGALFGAFVGAMTLKVPKDETVIVEHPPATGPIQQ